MINKAINHPYTCVAAVAAFGVGLGLIIGGALSGHTVTDIAASCGTGSALIVGAAFVAAKKIDLYFKKKQFDEDNANPQASYTPSSRDWRDWEKMREANDKVPIASTDMKNDDPNAIGNSTLDGLNRRDIGIQDEDL